MQPDVTHDHAKRLHAKRLPAPFARRVQLSVRVSAAMLDSLRALADSRRMSLNEFSARLIYDFVRIAPQR